MWCSSCWGITSSAYTKSKCYTCSTDKYCELCNVWERMTSEDKNFFSLVEIILWKDFWNVIKNFNEKWCLLVYKRTASWLWRLWWLKEWYGKKKFFYDYPDVLLSIKTYAPIQRSVFYECLQNVYAPKKRKNDNKDVRGFAMVYYKYVYELCDPKDDYEMSLLWFFVENDISIHEIERARGNWSISPELTPELFRVYEKATECRQYINHKEM